MFLRKYEILRDAEGEGGSGGGASDDMTALQKRNEALEARLAQQQGQINDITKQSKAQSAQQQRDAAEGRVEQAVSDAGAAVDIAERELAAAHEDGEGPQIAAAQRKMSEAAAKKERVNAEADNFRRQMKEEERRPTGSSDLDTTNLDSWKDRNNTWYGIDQEMTRASHEIDSSVRAAGTFKVGSAEYFTAIDRAMKQRFPDRYSGAPASAAARDEQTPGRSTPRRYNESIQRGMDAFGMDAKAWDAARQKAVSKGLLPETPATGRIRA